MTAYGVIIAGMLYLFDAVRFFEKDPPMALALLFYFAANCCLAWKMQG